MAGDQDTGLTQQVAAMSVHAAPPGLTPVDVQPAAPASVTSNPLGELLEQEALTHFRIIRAAQAIVSQIIPRDFATIDDSRTNLRALAYNVGSSESWLILGLSPLEGP